MQYTVSLSTSDFSQRFVLSKGEKRTIGTSAKCDIVLPVSTGAGDFLAVIYYKDHPLLCAWQPDKNPLYVNSRLVQKCVLLAPNKAISFSARQGYSISVTVSEELPSVSSPSTYAADSSRINTVTSSATRFTTELKPLLISLFKSLPNLTDLRLALTRLSSTYSLLSSLLSRVSHLFLRLVKLLVRISYYLFLRIYNYIDYVAPISHSYTLPSILSTDRTPAFSESSTDTCKFSIAQSIYLYPVFYFCYKLEYMLFVSLLLLAFLPNSTLFISLQLLNLLIYLVLLLTPTYEVLLVSPTGTHKFLSYSDRAKALYSYRQILKGMQI